MKPAIVAAVASLTLTACAGQPPREWTSCTGQPRCELDVSGLQHDWTGLLEPPGGSDAGYAWWEGFNDPVMNELIAHTQSRNLDLRLAEARLREVRAQRTGANAALFPQLDASVDFSRAPATQFGTSSAGESTGESTGQAQSTGQPRNLVSAAAVVNWEVDLFGRLRSERRAATAAVQASVSDRDAVRLSVLSEAARSYLEYRLYRMQQSLAVKTAEAQERTLRITRARFDQGMGSRLDLERAINLLATTRANIPLTEEQAESSLQQLAVLTAWTATELRQLLEKMPAGLPDQDAMAVLLTPTQVLAQRPDVRAAERRLLETTELHNAAAALRYPQLNLSALIGVESGEASKLLDSGNDTWSIGAGLLAPLFDFGRIRAAIDAADARQEQAWLSYEQTARVALQEAQTALVLYTQGKRRQHELTLALTSAQRAAVIARRQYAEGALSMLEVLDAERNVYTAEQAGAESTAAVSLRLIGVYQTLGVVPPLPAEPDA